jgi:hypothetical protein
VELRVLDHALKHGREHRLDGGVLLHARVGFLDELIELRLELLDLPATRADDVRHLAVVQQSEEQVLDRDVLVPPPDGFVDGEFEGCLQGLGDHLCSGKREKVKGKSEVGHFCLFPFTFPPLP